jgi:hypothetical protein
MLMEKDLEKDASATVHADRGGATWVIYDGKRVAKFQYVGTDLSRGYFTIVPVEKSGPQQRTEYLTDSPAAVSRPLLSRPYGRGPLVTQRPEEEVGVAIIDNDGAIP